MELMAFEVILIHDILTHDKDDSFTMFGPVFYITYWTLSFQIATPLFCPPKLESEC